MMFDVAFEFLLKWEGGHGNDPDDRGGETKFGISKKAYPDLDIAALTQDQAKEIYRKDYWLKGRCDKMPHPVGMVHFDCCVNTGIRQAARILQRALVIDDDGVIGPKTLQAIQLEDPYYLALSAITERDAYYGEIVERNPSQKKFIKGWKNRTQDLRRLVNG